MTNLFQNSCLHKMFNNLKLNIIKIIDFFDIQEGSTLVNSANQSFIARFFNFFLARSQTFFKPFSESLFLKNIDNSLIVMLTLLLASLTVFSTGIIGVLSVCCFVLFLLKLLTKQGEKIYFSSIDIVILIYSLIVFLSVFYSYLPFAAAKGMAKMLVYLGIYLAFLYSVKNTPKLSIYFIAAIASIASLEALYAVYQQVAGVEALASWQDMSRANPEQLMNRVYGTLKPYNPNLLAGFLISSFAPAVGCFFYCLVKKLKRQSFLAGAGVLLILLAIIFTGSRGAYIAIVGMMIVIVMVSGHIIWKDSSVQDCAQKKGLKKLWLYIIIAGISLIIIAVIISPALQHRIASIFAARGDSSNSFRMNVWIASFKMFLDNWLIGIGPGNTVFRLTYGMYMTTGFDALGAYCVALEIACESGIIALLAFFWIVFLVVVKSVKIVLSEASLERKIIICTCMTGIVGIMLHGLVDTIFYRPQVNIIFWMLVAVFSASISTNIRYYKR